MLRWDAVSERPGGREEGGTSGSGASRARSGPPNRSSRRRPPGEAGGCSAWCTYVVSSLDEIVAQVRANETRTSRHKNPPRSLRPRLGPHLHRRRLFRFRTHACRFNLWLDCSPDPRGTQLAPAMRCDRSRRVGEGKQKRKAQKGENGVSRTSSEAQVSEMAELIIQDVAEFLFEDEEFGSSLEVSWCNGLRP